MKDYRDYRYNYHYNYRGRRDHNHGWFGFVILIVGLAILAKQFGFYFLHVHLWPFILIALGLFIGIKSRFRSVGAYILMAIGALNIIPRFVFMGVESSDLALPVLLILGGLVIMLRPRRKKDFYIEKNMTTSTNPEDTLDIHVTFGGKKAVVTSKQFKGGTISTTFGGTEINLMQADSTETMVLDLQVSFGGIELIVPSHWDVQINIQPTFGSVEDHRVIRTPAAGEQKQLLVLRGNCSFGSIELKSY